ncbi:GTPase activating protein [Mycoemilia scoparia]|uniref:GTPase activating protein n=1 Tax=Mycoemilia scoparia TaxID=417184 RepID=A0A9W8A9I4_9FUNG|nr:GTPase activating protein [Mycoemilia scoparia]
MGGGAFIPMNNDNSEYCMVGPDTEKLGLLYSKSKVYIYRSNKEGDRIPGFICLVQGGSPKKYYLAWTPEALLPEKDRESYVQVELYPNLSEPRDHVSGIKDRLKTMTLDDTNGKL